MNSIISYAKLNLKKEYEELITLLFFSSLKMGGVRGQAYTKNRINELLYKIILEYNLSCLMDIKEFKEDTKYIKLFKEETKYGIGLWLHESSLLLGGN